MGFNRRKMQDERRRVAEKEAAARRATDAQLLEDAERLITAWNERQEMRMPMLFSPLKRFTYTPLASRPIFPISALPDPYHGSGRMSVQKTGHPFR
jgi:hypothetical protein